MENDHNLKYDLNSFISERLQQSYKIASSQKEYTEQQKKFRALEKNFLSKLKNINLIDEYDEINNIKLYLDSIELQEAYLIGFKDSNIINSNKL